VLHETEDVTSQVLLSAAPGVTAPGATGPPSSTRTSGCTTRRPNWKRRPRRSRPTAGHLEAQTGVADRAQREAEAARRAASTAEVRLEAVFAQAPVAIVVTDGPEHRCTLVNARAEAFAGRGDLVGRTHAAPTPSSPST
jgi:PAS domain-containing protein